MQHIITAKKEFPVSMLVEFHTVASTFPLLFEEKGSSLRSTSSSSSSFISFAIKSNADLYCFF
jgi:hypothetical protein